MAIKNRDRDENSYYEQRSPLQIVISEIIFRIRNENDMEEAATIFLNNNITFEQVAHGTMRLSRVDIAQLADTVLKLKS